MLRNLLQVTHSLQVLEPGFELKAVWQSQSSYLLTGLLLSLNVQPWSRT